MDYKKELKNKLEGLKNIEGFPEGIAENILELSELPNYTSCPNPFISDFISLKGKAYDKKTDKYYRTSYNGDVEEGKRHPIYMTHSYHTKVPHKAIMKYIEHFTLPQEIILDAYSGSGMTGVAAQLLNRNSILIDLSPAATFISYNNNYSLFEQKYLIELKEIIAETKNECRKLFTLPNGDYINYIIWSEVYNCPICNSEIIFWDSFVDKETDKVKDFGKCNSCGADKISKRSLKKSIDSNGQPQLIPVEASILKGKTKVKRKLSKDEASYLIEQEGKITIPYWYPTNVIPDGYNLNQPKRSNGLQKISDFYFNSSLYCLSKLWDLALKSSNPKFGMFFCTSILGMRCTKRMPYRPKGLSAGAINNLSIPSLIQSYNPVEVAERKFSKNFTKAVMSKTTNCETFISTQSATDLNNIPANSIDYIFTDPPFGSNIMYSDMNFLWESWLKVFTENEKETIINQNQQKGDNEYSSLLNSTFAEYFRVLKPKRWITVEFNNSRSKIWNTIRDSINSAGFIISQVSVLDKKLGSFKQVSSDASVDKDLIIFAFKPADDFNDKIVQSNNGVDLEFEFIEQYLSQLRIDSFGERTAKSLYAKLVGFYIQHGFDLKIDAKEFFQSLYLKFIEEDGLWFTSSQINSYIEFKKKMKLEGMSEISQGLNSLFVIDENSAIVWLFNFLSEPKSFSDISITFNKLMDIKDDQVPELLDLLSENFVFENGLYRIPKSESEHTQIAEKRQKHLWREFEIILIKAQSERKKIKEVRKEALSYGFERCYKEKRFKDILTIASKLHPSILENNGELSDFVEAAEIQTDGLA